MDDRDRLPVPRWGPELDEQNWEFARLVLDQLLPVVVQLHRANAAELGLDPSMLAVLDVVGAKDPLSISVLAGRCSLSHAATARAVERLVEQGWVERLPDPHDRRSWMVGRAPGTEAALENSRADLRHELADAAASMRPAARTATLHALIQVVERVSRTARAKVDRRWTETQFRRWQERNRLRH